MPWWSCCVTVMDCLVDPTEGLWRLFRRDIAVDGMDYNDVTWTTCSLKWPIIQPFVEQLMWTHVKETSTSALLTRCEGNSPVAGDFPAQRTINAEKLLFDDVIMDSAWSLQPFAWLKHFSLRTWNYVVSFLDLTYKMKTIKTLKMSG